MEDRVTQLSLDLANAEWEDETKRREHAMKLYTQDLTRKGFSQAWGQYVESIRGDK